MKFIVKLEHDPGIQCPDRRSSQWTLYSFNPRHQHFKSPEDIPLDLGMRRKLKVGTAFVLDYFEHGQGEWSIGGTSMMRHTGDWQWDGRSGAGLLVWNNPVKELPSKNYAERKKDAEQFLELYNAWANGEGYYFSVEVEDQEGGRRDLDSCGGFYGIDATLDYMFELISASVRRELKKRLERLRYKPEIEFEGDAAWLADHREIELEEVTG